MPKNFVAEFTEHADDAWITANGAQMVARAWTDPEYLARMLVDGTAAACELGFEFPEHHRNLVVLENTPTVHNVIVCTLCSCTAYSGPLRGPSSCCGNAVGAPSKRDDRWRACFSIATHVARCSEAAPLWCMGGSPVEPSLASIPLLAPPVLRRALCWPAPSAHDLRAEGRG